MLYCVFLKGFSPQDLHHVAPRVVLHQPGRAAEGGGGERSGRGMRGREGERDWLRRGGRGRGEELAEGRGAKGEGRGARGEDRDSLPLCLYQLRHGGASHDLLYGHRTEAEVRARGRWKSELLATLREAVPGPAPLGCGARGVQGILLEPVMKGRCLPPPPPRASIRQCAGEKASSRSAGIGGTSSAAPWHSEASTPLLPIRRAAPPRRGTSPAPHTLRARYSTRR